MVDITYRLSGPWGGGKGANLQPSEVDNNFWAIAQALVDLESNPAQPVGIESITMSGTQMTIHLTDGSTMGPFLIPVLAFSWRGEWQPSTSYAELDVFTVSDTGVFLVLLAHTSGATFDPAITAGDPPAPALQQLFGATDGTLSGLSDVTITDPTSGQLLQYSGTEWTNVDLGAFEEGVISVAAGTGLAAAPDPIIASGTMSLAPVSDKNFLANTSGASAAPVPHSLTQFLDAVASFNRGSVLVRNSTGWTALGAGTAGQFLKTNGAGADASWDSPTGSGSVTSVSGGTGIATSPAPITGTGTVSLAAIADARLLANVSGGSAAPVATALSALIDYSISTTQGSILYRSGSAWVALAPGTSGYFLASGGAAANPSWTVAPTTPGAVPNQRIISNISGSSAVPSANTLDQILDAILSSARSSIIYRGSSGWVALAPGTAGQVLSTGTSSSNPSWITVGTTLDGLSDVTVTSPQTYDALVYGVTAGQWTRTRPRYVIGCYTPGTMTADQDLLFHRTSKAITIPANFGAYLGHSSAAGGSAVATNSTVVTLAKALAASPTTFSNVGSITVAAGSANGTWSTQAAITFATGDVLRVRGPATPDPNLADFHMTLVAFET